MKILVLVEVSEPLTWSVGIRNIHFGLCAPFEGRPYVQWKLQKTVMINSSCVRDNKDREATKSVVEQVSREPRSSGWEPK